MNSKKIDIRPTTGVYATYKNLRYEPWTAIAEFVDNSTQSYFDHQSQLKALNNFEKLHIDINYEENFGEDDILTITDNAYGMEFSDFERAIKIDKPPKNTSGRNEFGMGLKTAACWFGNFWTITSTQLGSNKKYSASIDVNKLSETHEDYIDYVVEDALIEEHYTILKITNLNKKIKGGRTKGKIKDLLASIYRQDLRRNDIVICYDGYQLKFDEVEVYTEQLPNGELREWKKRLDFTIKHDNQILPVSGFVAIRKKGSVSDAGLSLLRRNRVIIGGVDQNYRPKELFGNSNEFPYQRIFGELNMDDWKVTQAKDNFDWHNNGLEEEFIKQLQPLMQDLIEKSKRIRIRQKTNSANIVSNAVKELENAGIIENVKITSSEEKIILNQENEIADIDEDDTSVIIEGPKTFEVELDRKGLKYNFLVKFDDYTTYWLIIEHENNIYKITLNMKHPFFKSLIDDSKYVEVMTKFVFSMAIAEIESMNTAIDGKIDASTIRVKMNAILEESLNFKRKEEKSDGR